MELRIQLDRISCGDVALKLLPILCEKTSSNDNATAKLVAAVAQLPPSFVRDFFDLIPQEKTNEIVSAFISENEDRILASVNRLTREHNLGITLRHLSISKDLEITATVQHIDYPALIETLLPLVRDALLARGGMISVFRPMIETATPSQICTLLYRLFGNNLDSFLVALINQNQSRVISLLSSFAQKQNIHLEIRTLSLQV